MPRAHREHAEWTRERIADWAKKTGPQTAALLESIMGSKLHPLEGFKRCVGILRLADRYPRERLERACARALHFGTRTYRSVETILASKLDQQPLPGDDNNANAALPLHENIRGSRYYVH